MNISGSPEALVGLSRVVASDPDAVVELAPVVDLGPYADAAAVMRIRADAHSGLAISKARDELLLSGSQDGLETLARNIGRLGRDPVAMGGHIHIEFFPGHPYLREGSLPIVVEAN